ncbi:MAG: hypothetical protein JST84_12070 [Acidobacteria bacterium]|nr:hypothetical protein [Acidobacteriota bacterium]
MERKISYLQSALKEPLNVGGLLLAVAGTAYASLFGAMDAAVVAVGAIVSESAYLAIVPASIFYRRIVDQRARHALQQACNRQRQELIKTFDPREREAVEYLSWMKTQIGSNFKKFARLKDDPPQMRELETAWEAFVDLLDEYRRRKMHLRSINPQAVENQLRQAERTCANADDATRPLHEKNVQILRRRLDTFNDIERSVKRVEAQLQMIENFFGLVNDQVVTMPGPEYMSSLDFDTLISSIESTREMLQHTAPIMSQLDSFTSASSSSTATSRPTLAAERR